MSRLTDIETNLVQRIAGTQVLSQPLMATVRGASGGYRPALRASLSRERMPAAYVAYVDEATSPDAPAGRRGPRFAVIVAARSLRTTSNPRIGDGDTIGAYLVIDTLRSRLDNYAPIGGTKATPVRDRFLEADDRTAFYELLYRIAPTSPPPQFDGEPLGGEASVTTRALGVPEPPPFAKMIKQPSGVYQIIALTPFPPPPPLESTLLWRGEFRAADGAGLDALLDAVGAHVTAGTVAELTDGTGAVYPGMTITALNLLCPRFVDAGSGQHVQACEIVFVQGA